MLNQIQAKGQTDGHLPLKGLLREAETDEFRDLGLMVHVQAVLMPETVASMADRLPGRKQVTSLLFKIHLSRYFSFNHLSLSFLIYYMRLIILTFQAFPDSSVGKESSCNTGVVVKVTQSCPTLATPWTVAHQVPLSMGFSRQKYWSGLPFP